jgi:cytosine/adenosine deaminase-related metal-dependent hydrolase
LLGGLIDLAITHQLPVAMHLAESSEELQLLAHGDGPFQQLLDERSMWDPTAIPGGTGVLEYLIQMARAPRCLVVHGNYLNGREFEFLAQNHRRMTVVYCPRTHAYFGHRAYPLTKMLAAGVRIALGTDSRASSPDLSLLAEIREVARKHSGIPAEQIVRLGTLAGAQALGWEDFTGSITPGKWANLTAIPCDRRCRDPYTVVVEGEATPAATWLRGEMAFCREASG